MDAFDFVDDPITAAQVRTLVSLLGDEWSEKARDGFLIISGRFVNDFGADRTDELALLYRTHLPAGRVALRRSLEVLLDSVGTLARFERDFPVYINDPEYGSMGIFPQLPMLGIAGITPKLFRVTDSEASVHGTGEPLRDFIIREGRLPYLEPPPQLVLRKKLRIHWCSYDCYESPMATRAALQILSAWKSDCKLRATLPTTSIEGTAFVAFNGDTVYSDNTPGEFAGYFVELQARDHPDFPGGGLQIGVVGAPVVSSLEEWVDSENRWNIVWRRPHDTP